MPGRLTLAPVWGLCGCSVFGLMLAMLASVLHQLEDVDALALEKVAASRIRDRRAAPVIIRAGVKPIALVGITYPAAASRRST
jgi:hypothetical protein